MPITESEIRNRLSSVAVSQIGDVMDRLGLVDSAISPVWKGARFVGRAVTVLTAAGDNKVIHDVIPTLREGDVLVINGQGSTSRALIGELMAERGQRKGCVAYVIDGAIRDVDEIGELRFPVYARAITPAGPYRNGPGRIGVPVAIGGVVVSPGDWIVGDADGLVVISNDDVDVVLVDAERKREKEAQQQLDIRAGLVDV
ncbi:methyltransferase [Paramicrobacterium chengjingii]|uniref:Putative 4-hydroxy-4-methyl-2-oxoglutarate aldolase n=1 Tax=Paramicrobacterium chengjingii TaxID=2769067 RepID=A0ABX6YI79_9MICO|nr:methyltransferase [Microbacterium chengjingii]QPZ38042.1 methyltransferase [Microbacterium chengjingii]